MTETITYIIFGIIAVVAIWQYHKFLAKQGGDQLIIGESAFEMVILFSQRVLHRLSTGPTGYAIFKRKIYGIPRIKVGKNIVINFSEYKKYLIVDGDDINKIKAVIIDMLEMHKTDITIVDKSRFRIISKDKTIIIIKLPDDISYFTFNNVISWITYSIKKSMVGIAINNVDPLQSYYLTDDKSGIHENSLVGKMINGKKFQIELPNFEENATLLNSRFEIPIVDSVQSYIKLAEEEGIYKPL